MANKLLIQGAKFASMGQANVQRRPPMVASVLGDFMELDHDERRSWRRYSVPVKGRLFSVFCGALDCEVLDLSPGGARIQMTDAPPEGPVVLYIDRIGRIEAELFGRTGEEVRLRFVCSEARRHDISQTLGQMIQNGVARMTRLRRQNRISLSNFHFVRACGTLVSCDALDISLRGMSLRTETRPPVGEFIMVGQSHLRVVRHHDQGIAVEFIQPGAGAVVRFPAAYDRGGEPRAPV
jgi:hypothetical protein